jgi:hypothetical protein
MKQLIHNSITENQHQQGGQQTQSFVKEQEKTEKYEVSIPKTEVIFKNVFLLPLGP